MINSTSESISAILLCTECDDTKEITLDRNLVEILGRQGNIRIFCGICERGTSWRGVQADRRSGFDRRNSPHARLALPIIIRCDHPELQFLESTRPETASKKGASFFTRQPLHEGMSLSVELPFKQDARSTNEFPARVVWVRRKDGGWLAGVELQGLAAFAETGVA